ncbi:alpha/beta fold hydrolase [Acidovorax sp. 59]|uniref:alpha/beta fold hydrolase n=2 Tax=unclassified Acidovorax TaxID=2684926 RepID=UPI001E47337E|nr:alpha/beta hydrolase [Acidovorax sp. 59]
MPTSPNCFNLRKKEKSMLSHLFKSAVFALALATTNVSVWASGTPAERVDSAREEFPAPAGFAPGFRSVDGVNLHYLKGGKGKLVLLVHGYGQTWYEWRYLMPELAKTHTVVAVDLPALGQSGSTKSYAGQDVAKQLHKFAKSFSPDAPFDLVAHDIGIWNTYPMVVQNQDDVRRVAFMEAPIPDEGLYGWPAFTDKGASLAWHFSFFNLTAPLPEKMLAGKERVFLEDFILTRAVNKKAFPPDVLDMYAKSWAKPASLTASLEYYRALNETAQRNKPLAATKLTMPVLAIGGGNSMGAYQGEQLRKYAVNVQSETIQGCGHWLPEECPNQLNSLVVNFLTAK